jgi:RNA polymerase sigma factor (sigma-70 family)
MTELLLDPGAALRVPALGRPPESSPDQIVAAAYAAHWGWLQRRLLTLTRDAGAAEDIAQESFVRLTTVVRAGRAPDNVAAWLYRVAVNLVASRGRHASVVERRQADLLERDTAPSPESASIDAEEHRALRAALATLAPIDREAVLLAAHGYRGPEIARRLNRTDGATRTMLCRARSKLRVRLQAAGIEA